MGHSPASLRIAAAVQAAESAVVLVATALALVAMGLARARRWSRTPALLTQLFFGIVGIYLLQSRRLDWGVVSVVLAAAGFAAVLAPPSLRALVSREGARPDQRQTGRQARTGQAQTGQAEPGP